MSKCLRCNYNIRDPIRQAIGFCVDCSLLLGVDITKDVNEQREELLRLNGREGYVWVAKNLSIDSLSYLRGETVLAVTLKRDCENFYLIKEEMELAGANYNYRHSLWTIPDPNSDIIASIVAMLKRYNPNVVIDVEVGSYDVNVIDKGDTVSIRLNKNFSGFSAINEVIRDSVLSHSRDWNEEEVLWENVPKNKLYYIMSVALKYDAIIDSECTVEPPKRERLNTVIKRIRGEDVG